MEGDRAIAEARNQALAAREAVREEVLLRNQAVEASEAMLDERERTYRDRRAVFDDRRHLPKQRREEINDASGPCGIDAERMKLLKRGITVGGGIYRG